MRETALEEVHHLNVVVREAVTDEDYSAGGAEQLLRFEPDSREMRVAIVFTMRRCDQERPQRIRARGTRRSCLFVDLREPGSGLGQQLRDGLDEHALLRGADLEPVAGLAE